MGFVFYPPVALLLAWLAQSGVLSQAPRAIGVLLRIPSALFAIWMIYLAGSAAFRLLVFGVRSIAARSEQGRDDILLALLYLARLPLYLLLFGWLASASHWWGLRPSPEPTPEGRPSVETPLPARH
ncbi:MAG TPA: hypothetical protein VKG23_17325 [Thermoanaerobaculia bacterium]|nr:hypothetical protein [Thermoanaerobaculia bacterium]